MGTSVGFIEFSCCFVQYFVFVFTLSMGRFDGIGTFVGNLNFGVERWAITHMTNWFLRGNHE
jgi:hypothetical protein